MLIDLAATLSAGLGLAGVALALQFLARGRLPAWIVPAAAGAGMLAFAIWSEYAWYPRTVAALPPGVVVVRAVEDRAPWRPWTYVRPIVTRFSAVDARGGLTHDDRPGEVLATVLLLARWAPGASVPSVFDCANGRVAPLADAGAVPAAGDDALDWTPLPPGDEALAAVCGASPLRR